MDYDEMVGEREGILSSIQDKRSTIDSNNHESAELENEIDEMVGRSFELQEQIEDYESNL